MLGNCFYCGVALTEPYANGRNEVTSRTRDHVIPRSKGGVETIAACACCNNRKSDFSLEDFRIKFMNSNHKWDGIFWGEMNENDRQGVTLYFAPSRKTWKSMKTKRIARRNAQEVIGS